MLKNLMPGIFKRRKYIIYGKFSNFRLGFCLCNGSKETELQNSNF